MPRRNRIYIGLAWGLAFGLAVGAPIGWVFSRFQPPAYSPHVENSNETAKAAAAHAIQEPEGWGTPLVIMTGLLCAATLALALYTRGLFKETARLARDSNANSRAALAASTRGTETLINVERAYLTGGGDVQMVGGKRNFRVEVANYGKTAAYLTNYEINFAPRLADVRKETGSVYTPSKKTSEVFDDRIAPDNAVKVIAYVPMKNPESEIIYGCFWYTDWRKKEQYFRFILRVNKIYPLRPRTMPNVDGVHESYREWT